jgi:predicted RNA-binding protein associated with RNAse of E/G family
VRVRNAGSTVDVGGRRLLERDGNWYDLDRLEVTGSALFYSRPIAGSEHFYYHERWLLPEHTWSVSRFTFHDHFREGRVDWYIEMDAIEVKDGLWRVKDGYLDVAVFEGARYEVWDADELADGIRDGEISVDEAIGALHALHRLATCLAKNGHSGAALLAEFAPGLPV